MRIIITFLSIQIARPSCITDAVRRRRSIVNQQRFITTRENMHESQHSSGRPFPLSMADEGESVRIVLHRGGKGLEKRLTSLGLNRDSEVRIVHRRGGSLVVGRADSRFALGAGMAQKILVVRA